MHIYAQLDENNVCIGVSSLSGEVNDASIVEMDTYTLDVIGKRYVDGEWQDIPKEPIPPEPSQEEIMQEKLSKLSDKLDRQSAALLQIGMAVVKPPDASEIPEVPPVPPAPTNPAGAPPVPDGMPDAETLKKLMGTS